MFDGGEIFWIGFFAFIGAMLVLDLFVFNRKSHEVGVKEALRLSALWIALAIGFNILVWFWFGSQKAMEFTTGYVLELTLSVDNLFVFIMVFGYFCTPKACLHKVLFWGIIGALIFRGIFILVGVTLVEQFSWILYIFGIFLIITSLKMAFQKEKKIDPKNTIAVRLFRKVMPVTDEYDGDHFVVRHAGILMATPLLVTLVFVESTDIVFALDSIPAILSITTDPFIVYTSNAFAILGLRSLFFALQGSISAFCYLKYGLAVILGFVGAKMLLSGYVHIPVLASLAVIVVVLLITIALSMYVNKGKQTCEECAYGPEEKH
jgi:tellurite resistance protein TerC